MHWTKSVGWLLVGMLVLLAMGCVQATGGVGTVEPDTEEGALEGSEWVLLSLHGEPPIEGTRITLAFTEEEISGFAGCNFYGASYTAGEGTLEIGEIARQQEGCITPEGVMDQEQLYLDALSSASAYQVVEEQLEIADAAGNVILLFERQEEVVADPAALQDTRWRLQSMDGAPIEDVTVTLAFLGDRVVGRAGCRAYVGTYLAEGDEIRLLQLAMLGTEECLTQDALWELEGEYTTALSDNATNYRLDPEQLEILTAPGGTLHFEPLPEDVGPALEGTTWRLLGLLESEQVEGGDVALLVVDALVGAESTARFENGMVGGSGGCNSYSAPYEVNETGLVIGDVSQTMMYCDAPEGITEQEQRFLDTLAAATSYHLVGDLLWLAAEDGRALLLTSSESGVGG